MISFIQPLSFVAAQKAARSENLIVVGIHRCPVELLFQVIGGGLLDEGVFGVAHIVGKPSLSKNARFLSLAELTN